MRGYLRILWKWCFVVAATVDPFNLSRRMLTCTCNLFFLFSSIHATQTFAVCLYFPSSFRGKPCRSCRSCFDSLCSKLSSLSSHGFIHKISSKPKPLSVLRQLSVYSNRGEKGEFFFLFLFACIRFHSGQNMTRPTKRRL